MVSTVNKLVWFSEIKWDYLVTRKQQILTRFSKNWEILFIEPYVVGKQQNWLPKREGKITVITIPFLKSIPGGMLAHLQDSALLRRIAGWLGQFYVWFVCLYTGFSTRERLIGLSSPFWGKIAATCSGSLHFYDANDAHLDFPGIPIWVAEYLITYVKKADLCFAVSPEISESITKLGARNVILLGNGVDFEHFSRPRDIPAHMESLRRPILGYAGAMDWLDAALIRRCCETYPDADLVLIGPEIKPGWFANQHEFQGLANLYYLGKVAYPDLPAYVQHFTVALIPFVVNELTRPLNPNKLYEYSAAGCPIVSMNYSSTIDNLSDTIFVADNSEAFLEQISTALDKGADEKQLELARSHSWNGVADVMESKLLGE